MKLEIKNKSHCDRKKSHSDFDLRRHLYLKRSLFFIFTQIIQDLKNEEKKGNCVVIILHKLIRSERIRLLTERTR